jgi:SPP1 gp7 family putative phage head morphogenesis protein
MSEDGKILFGVGVEPEAALKFFRSKGLKTGFSWQDVWKEEHDAAFTVAKMMDVDLLKDMRDAVDKAISDGQTFSDFRKSVQPMLVDRGWWGRAEMTDPLTGEVRDVQLGSVRRLKTIFQTNMQMSYSAADRQRYEETKQSAPYLMYDAVDDSHTRPEHHAWDGTILRGDNPWWKTHTPPNGFGCRCSIIQLSGDDLRSMGRSVDAHAPPVQYYEFTNRRTGEIEKMPQGVDPGFNYQPGDSRVEYLSKLLDSKVAAFNQ